MTHQLIRHERFLIIHPDAALIRDIPQRALLVAAGPDPELLPRGIDLGDPSLFLGIERRSPAHQEVVFE